MLIPVPKVLNVAPMKLRTFFFTFYQNIYVRKNTHHVIYKTLFNSNTSQNDAPTTTTEALFVLGFKI